MSDQTQWTTTWPTTPGQYWAYGFFSQMKKDTPRLELATVRGPIASGGMMYAWRGGFLFPEEARLLWTPAQVPEPPPDSMIPTEVK